MSEGPGRLLAVSLWVLVACGGRNPPVGEVVEVPRPALEDGRFPLAEVTVTKVQVPAKFAEALPTSVTALEAAQAALPVAYWQHRLCAGDTEVIERFRLAVTVAAAGATPDALRKSYGSLLQFCERPSVCSWTRAAVEAGGALGEVAWVGLTHCRDAETEALFAGAAVPAQPLVHYWNSRSREDGFSPRPVAALGPALRSAIDAGDSYLVRQAAFLAVKLDGGEGVAALVALHGQVESSKLRDEIAAALVGAPAAANPAAHAIASELCGRAGRKDAACGDDGELTRMLEKAGFSVVGADGVRESPRSPPAAAGTASFETRLRQLGMLDRGPLLGGPEAPGVSPSAESAQELLVRSGPVHCFDVETGTFPNQHDALLFDLAELAGPAWAGALFAEDAPTFAIAEGRWLVDGTEVDRLPPGRQVGEPYRLHAYVDGNDYQVEAQDFGDWYDLDQALGLLNAVAVGRGLETRFVALPTEDQMACVLVGPKLAIATAVSEGILALGGADDARQSGQGFEREVLEKMR